MKPEYTSVENKHCCKKMESILEGNTLCLQYYAPIRLYHIDDRYNPSAVPIDYCPWCGSKLPESLFDKQEEILEKEYGLTDTWEGGKDYDNVPKEFLTDEWWKKRGL